MSSRLNGTLVKENHNFTTENKKQEEPQIRNL